MPKIEFSAPHLRKVRRVIEYEVDGIAFIEGYEKTVGFTFEFGYSPNNLRLEIEDLYQAKELYFFFKQLFKGLVKKTQAFKSMGRLLVEWEFAEGKLEEMLQRVKEAMGKEWEEALRKMMSVFNSSH